MARAIFLDRDGVLNENRSDYVKSWQEFVWLPGSLDALATLAVQDRPVIIITNQSIVGRGLVARAILDDVHSRMRQQAQAHGGRIDAVYACLHAPTDLCICRKPLPGLLHRAALELQIDLATSVFIGDAFTDYQAATAAGVPYIQVRSGKDASDTPRVSAVDAEVPIVADLRAAVELAIR